MKLSFHTTIKSVSPMQVSRLNLDGSTTPLGTANDHNELRALLPKLPDFHPSLHQVAIAALEHELKYHLGEQQATRYSTPTDSDPDASFAAFDYHTKCISNIRVAINALKELAKPTTRQATAFNKVML